MFFFLFVRLYLRVENQSVISNNILIKGEAENLLIE